MSAAITLGSIVLALIIGVPVGAALIGGALLGAALFLPGQVDAISSVALQSAYDPTFVAIPLFIIAGSMVACSGFMDALLNLEERVLGRLRGGMAVSCVGTALFFAGATGSTAGESAALASSYQGPMVARGYGKAYSGALIAASGALGVLIPPSITLIIYGTIAGYPVQRLWTAGLVPALVASAGVLVVALLRGRKQVRSEPAPALSTAAVAAVASAGTAGTATVGAASVGTAGAGAGAGTASTGAVGTATMDTVAGEPAGREARHWGGIQTILELIAVIGLPVVVLGGIYGGLLTITETAAIAVAYVTCFGLLFRKAGPRKLGKGFIEGAKRGGVIFLIFIGAHALSYLLSYMGTTQGLITSVTSSGLPRWVVLALVVIAVIALGSLMDGLALMVVVTPLLFPLIGPLQLSPVQLGVMLALTIEIGVVHPPVGMNLFAVSSVTGLPIGKLAWEIVPYIGVLLVTLGLVVYAPLPIFAWH